MNNEGISWMNLIGQNDRKYRDNAREFAEIFGIHLRVFWDNITGFDIIKFDDHIIQTPNDLSMEEYITQEWGEEAANLIKFLIN